MGLLSHLAEWCREHIPLVGGAIASLIEKVDEIISPRVEGIEQRISDLELSFNKLREALSSFIRDPFGYVKRVAENILNTVVSPHFDSFSKFIGFVTDNLHGLLEWFKDKAEWFKSKVLEFKDAVWNAIRGFIEPRVSSAESMLNAISEFIRDPLGFIKKTVSTWFEDAKRFVLDKFREARSALWNAFNELNNKFNEFTSFVNEKVSGFINAVLHIDDFLKQKLYVFIADFVAWFIYTFLKDLFTLEYDLTTHEVVGEAKNPLTKYMIEEIEISEPQYEYESVEEEVKA